MDIWNSSNKPKIEKFYEVYLYTYKYLLGFTQEGLYLAGDFKDFPNEECREASSDYLKLNINP